MNFEAADMKKTIKTSNLKKVGLIMLVALAIFSVTYLVHSILAAINITSYSTEITDWAFVSGVNDEQIRAENAVFKQATKNAPVSAKSSRPYTHLLYSFDASNLQRNLIIETNHAPLKAEINSNVIYNNGYQTEQITGNRFNEIVIPASDTAQTVHIYMYSPLEFKFSAYEGFNEYVLNLPVIFGIMVLFVGAFFLFCALIMKTDEILKAVVISIETLIFGVYACIFALQTTTSVLNGPIWYNVSTAMGIAVTSLCYLNIMLLTNCRRKETKFILAELFIISAAAVFVPFGLFFKILMFVCALVQGVLAFLVLVETESAGPFGFKGGKLLKTALAYMAILNIFSAFSTAFGFADVSESVLVIGVAVMNVILFTYFMKYVTVSKMIEEQRLVEADYFSEFCGHTSELVAKLYGTHSPAEFISVFCREIVPIVKSSKEIAVSEQGICYCTSLGKDGVYTPIENRNTDEQPDFAAINERIGKDNCVIGSSYIGVKFSSGTHECAAAYIGNIAIPYETGFKNYISALCSASQAVFMNNTLESDLFSVEEKLFLNLSKIVETRSDETSHHLANVSLMTKIICRQLGYSEDESDLIATAAMTHDIGKVAIPDAVLNKQGIYTPEERKTMQKHTNYGYNILSVSSGRFFEIAALIAKEHHENYDGTGYMGMKGNEISRYARIIRVVDTFDALVSKRCYKRAWEIEEAVEYINEKSGSEFDPEIVKAFNACKDEMILVRE